MKKVLFRVAVVLFMMTSLFFTSAFAVNTNPSETTTSEDYIPSEKVITITRIVEVPVPLKAEDEGIVETTDLNELLNLMKECQQKMDDAHNLAEAGRKLGYDENHPVIKLAKEEYQLAQGYLLRYQERYEYQLEQQNWDTKFDEHPAASYVWQYLKSKGLNDYVCAGIIGNTMAEVGGLTLDIQYWLDTGNGFIGMCQWAKCYYSGPANPTLEEQCEYLMSDIKFQIDTFGFCYKKGFNYEQFLELNNEQDAAIAFAKCYERCASQYVNIRAKMATTAYNYFTA